MTAITPSSSERAPERHELKTDPEVFQAVWDGRKTFEIRCNNRDFRVGDVLGLRETQHSGQWMAAGLPLIYTGRELDKRVSHILTGYGLDPAWCCLSFEPDRASLGAAQVPSPENTVSREDFDKIVGDLTRAKNLLVRLYDRHPEARAQIAASTGSWFVWGVDRDAAISRPSQQGTK